MLQGHFHGHLINRLHEARPKSLMDVDGRCQHSTGELLDTGHRADILLEDSLRELVHRARTLPQGPELGSHALRVDGALPLLQGFQDRPVDAHTDEPPMPRPLYHGRRMALRGSLQLRQRLDFATVS